MRSSSTIMIPALLIPVLLIAALTSASSTGYAQRPLEPFLQNLPAGVYLQKSILLDQATLERISKSLGAEVTRATNSFLSVHGSAIQVNGIETANGTEADKLFHALLRIKPKPFVLRHGDQVIEYVGRNLQPATAVKTSYELGFLAKPKSLRYRLQLEIAPVDEADYMSCNPLFVELLRRQRQPTKQETAEIARLAEAFRFGRTVTFRNPALFDGSIQVDNATRSGAATTIDFQATSIDHRDNIPYVKATLEATTREDAFTRQPNAPDRRLLAATARWPVNDPAIQKLAAEITAGKETHQDKAEAILRWLQPNRNIRYGGQTGSRWGVKKVLAQRFGHCWDFSDLFVTLTRASGVPSRQIAGWLYGGSGHAWAEYYREGKGWQQVDATGGGLLPCGIYHIAYFTTEDGEMPILYVSLPKIEILSKNVKQR